MVPFRPHILLSSLLLLLSCAAASIRSPPASPACNRRCGSYVAPYPFGFSAGCQIQLNCSAEGERQLGGCRVSNLTPDSIIVDVPFECNRSFVRAVRPLFGGNYAMTRRNFFFVRNCNGSDSCQISTDMLFTKLGRNSFSCGSGDDARCFAPGGGGERGALMNLHDVDIDARCFLFTSFRYGTSESNETSLVFGSAELAWWLDGAASCICSPNANITPVDTGVAGRKGCRCTCVPGFSGDGFRDGLGCFKENCGGVNDYISGNCKNSIRVGLLVGGLIAAASATFALACICHHVRRRYVASRNHKTTRRLLSERLMSAIAVYSYEDIECATNNFSATHTLGTGAYGTVYLGRFPGGELVAIKRLRHCDSGNLGRVVNEIQLISSVSHPNLVQLLGCCIDRGVQILVYEFVPNGTLCQHLRRQRGGVLKWPTRVSILADTAKAVAYLHNSVQPPIYHRDIKSSNILLDDEFKPKLADFGLSRTGMTESSHISTAPQGTPGYLDPQYHQDFHLSDKSDVYSFGVVLAEMLTGMKAVDFDRAPNEVNLASLAVDRIGRGLLEDIVDPLVLRGTTGRVETSVHKVAELAFRCLAFHKDARPSMAEVAEELERIRAQVLEPTLQVAEGLPVKSDMLGVKAEEEEEVVVSPVTVQEQWVSESSSSSSSCSLNNPQAQHCSTFGMKFY